MTTSGGYWEIQRQSYWGLRGRTVASDRSLTVGARKRTVQSCHKLVLLFSKYRAQIEHKPVIFNAGDDWWVALAQPPLGSDDIGTFYCNQPSWDGLLGGSAASNYRCAGHQLRFKDSVAKQCLGARAYFFSRLPDHGERRNLIPALQQQIAQRGFQSLANQFVQAQGAIHRIAPQARQKLCFAAQDACLR